MNYRLIASVDWLVVHCAASRADMNITIKDIRRLHLQRGFSDVGYHYFIQRDGTVEKGRTDTTPGAHARGYNMHSLGICMAGGCRHVGPLTISAEDWYATYAWTAKPENNFTPAQFKSLRKILADLKVAHPDAEILGHCDLPGVTKACPSFDVRAWWNDVRLAAVLGANEEQPNADDRVPTDPTSKAPNTRNKTRERRSRRHRRGRSSRI